MVFCAFVMFLYNFLLVRTWTRHAKVCRVNQDRSKLVNALEVTLASAWRLLDARIQEYLVVMK